MDRRGFVRYGALGAAAVVSSRGLLACTPPASGGGGGGPTGPYGSLGAADANGVLLPAGFTSRVIATSGQHVPGTSFTWHSSPDGACCVPRAGGG